jgi:hypothetical protein
MTSKEALERLLYYANINEAELITKYGYSASYDIKQISQDLDKLEKLEEENQVLLVNKNVAQGIAKKNKEENDKLKKAFDKAIEKCMKFDKCPPITCIELANDNDNVCKECWKKYFMKEVLGNE